VEELETLVVHNVENIRWATLRNLDDAFRRFSSVLEERLKEALEATRGAMRSAYSRRTERAETVGPELQRLGQIVAELNAAQKQLSKIADP
jgi:hypothetical protein